MQPASIINFKKERENYGPTLTQINGKELVRMNDHCVWPKFTCSSKVIV